MYFSLLLVFSKIVSASEFAGSPASRVQFPSSCHGSFRRIYSLHHPGLQHPLQLVLVSAPNPSRFLLLYHELAILKNPANLKSHNLLHTYNIGLSQMTVTKIETSRSLPYARKSMIQMQPGTHITSHHASPMRNSGTNLKLSTAESPHLALGKAVEAGDGEQGNVSRSMPSAIVVTKLIITMVWRKLIRNPSTHASIIGLVWSLISFRWNVALPKIIDGSITILSNTGLGMAMFSLGLFMALQPKIITCGKKLALISMAIRFLVGPIVVAVTSVAIGLRGDLLRVAILQAALPQGIVPFVFAKEYTCHAGILSTAVIFGMVIALPITIIYYILLGLKV